MRSLAVLLPAAALTGLSLGQTALLREGDPSPSGASGEFLTAVNYADVNESGGYACSYRAFGPSGFVDGIWGSLTGGAGAMLRTELTVGTLTQTSLEMFFGLSASSIVYSPLCDEAGGSLDLDGIWLEDTVVAIEEQPVPGTTDFYSFGSRPTMTEAGDVYFVGGYTDTAGGSTQKWALFQGATKLIDGGDSLPGLPGAVSAQGISFDYRVSPGGTNYIAEVTLAGGAYAIAINGVGLSLGGSALAGGVAVPPSIGGIGDAWDRFDYLGITEAGDYMITGDTGGSFSTDEFIIRAGSIWAREGDTIDGEVVRGEIESAVLNEANEAAYVWDIESGGSTIEALFFERTLLLTEGDAVDWDGDGMVDPGVVIEDFTGINPMALSSSGDLYFTADVEVGGSILEGLFHMSVGQPSITNYCMANLNSTGGTAAMSAAGSTSVALNDFDLICTGMPTFSFGFFILSQSQGFVMNPGGSAGNLCLAGSVGRFQLQIANSGSNGSITIAADLSALPQPGGPVAAAAGDTWNFQTWFRDVGPGGGPSSNFSDGLEVVFQ